MSTIVVANLSDILSPSLVTVQTNPGNITLSQSGITVVNKTVGQATGVVLPVGVISAGVFIVADGKGDAATNNITLTVSGGGTINGSSSLVINAARGVAAVFYNGTEYQVLYTR